MSPMVVVLAASEFFLKTGRRNKSSIAVEADIKEAAKRWKKLQINSKEWSTLNTPTFVGSLTAPIMVLAGNSCVAS